MFGTHFYHQRMTKAVASFGALFNNLYVVRKDSAGKVMSTVRVPLTYAPKEKYLERIRENTDLDLDTKTAVKLPRMSFEITSFQYDPQRTISKTNKRSAIGSSANSRSLLYAGTPYNINFQLSILADKHDDALQVVEQILPYFQPQYTLTMKPFADHPTILEDVPVGIVGSSFSDDFESALEQRRTIIYTLDFEMKLYFYGPIGDSSIIREVQTNYFLMGDDSDTPVSRMITTPDPINVSADSDFGFNDAKIDFIC